MFRAEASCCNKLHFVITLKRNWKNDSEVRKTYLALGNTHISKNLFITTLRFNAPVSSIKKGYFCICCRFIHRSDEKKVIISFLLSCNLYSNIEEKLENVDISKISTSLFKKDEIFALSQS